MTTTERLLTDDELRAAILGKRAHLDQCQHAHKAECAEMTRLEMDEMLDEWVDRMRVTSQ